MKIKFFKKTLGLIVGLGVIALILMGLTSVASAQTDEYQSVSLYVTDISLDKGTYSPGEEVTGSFIIHNINNVDINDANYIVSLAADYGDGGIPENIINTSERMEIPFMVANSKSTIDFSYTLPIVIGGNDFGINIRAVLDSGLELGWGDEVFSLEGNSLTLLDIKYASLKVLDQYFPTDTGPTVYSEDGASLEITVANSSDEIELTPYVVVKSQFNNEVVYDNELDDINALAQTDLEYTFPLFVDNLAPGVYLGELQLLDSDGINRISNLQFRYIIGGQIGTIQNVYTDVSAVRRGDTLPLAVNITGTPIDIVRFVDNSEGGNAKLEITIKDGDNHNVVGSTVMELDQLINQTLDIDVEIKKNVSEIIIDAVLYGSDGQTLDDYTISLPEGELPESDNMLVNIVSIIIGLIVIIVVAIIVKKKKDNGSDGTETVESKGTAALIILMSVIIGGVVMFGGSVEAVSVYVGQSGSEYGQARNINVSRPLPPSVKIYKPGETFNFNVSFKARSCHNGYQYINVYTFAENTWTEYPYHTANLSGYNGSRDINNLNWWSRYSAKTIHIYGNVIGRNTSDHRHSVRNFSGVGHSGYKIPENTPNGIYKFYFYIYTANPWSNGRSNYGWHLSYVNIRVDDGGANDLDGACGVADGNIYPSLPSNSYLCNAGSPIYIESNADGWEWICRGTETDSGICSAFKDNEGATDLYGACGPANNATSRPEKPVLRTDLCTTGAPTPVTTSSSGKKWEWDCVGTDRTVSCDVGIDLYSIPPVEPVISEEKMIPVIVNEGDTCTLYWKVTDSDSPGICRVSGEEDRPVAYSTSATPVEYSLSGLVPRKLYSVTCSDGVTRPDTSISLKCNLNPNLIEE